MADSNLTIILFLVGLAVNFLVAGVSQAGWRHRWIIRGLFVVAAVLLCVGVTWPWLKIYSPTVTKFVTEMATNSVAWFVIMMSSVTVWLVKPHLTRGSKIKNRHHQPVSTETEIESWFQETFRGSVVARDVLVWNFVHESVQDLKRRLSGSKTT